AAHRRARDRAGAGPDAAAGLHPAGGPDGPVLRRPRRPDAAGVRLRPAGRRRRRVRRPGRGAAGRRARRRCRPHPAALPRAHPAALGPGGAGTGHGADRAGPHPPAATPPERHQGPGRRRPQRAGRPPRRLRRPRGPRRVRRRPGAGRAHHGRVPARRPPGAEARRDARHERHRPRSLRLPAPGRGGRAGGLRPRPPLRRAGHAQGPPLRQRRRRGRRRAPARRRDRPPGRRRALPLPGPARPAARPARRRGRPLHRRRRRRVPAAAGRHAVRL
ncbi:MAG: Spermidine synthase, partial [uncultured Friedmanniella sp.]